LNRDNLTLAVEIGRIPEEIRGYGHVKARHLAVAREKWQQLMVRWRELQAPKRSAA
jgi:indolepyruvate ferredoxin oxidoreductase